MDQEYNDKVYVPVEVQFDKNGVMRPVSLLWEDGTLYRIDMVTDIRPALAARAMGYGDRYTIWINRRPSYLFFEPYYEATSGSIGRWFVERKGA